MAEPHEWESEVRLTSVGGVPVNADPIGEPRVGGNRAEVVRSGGVTEWYVNGPLGLEQGFTVDAPSTVATRGLRMELEVAGDLRAAQSGVDRLALLDANGRMVLRVGDAYAEDALGKPLPTRLRVDRGRLVLHVDDRGATYPITVDPLYSKEAALPSSASASDVFGYRVAVDGTTAVVGSRASGGVGAAYVYDRVGSGWLSGQTLLPPDATSNGELFGSEVALRGDTLVVGAMRKQVAIGDVSVTPNGAAYVYTRDGGDQAWRLQSALRGRSTNEYFGSTIALGTDTLAIGAPLRTGNLGAVDVFERAPDGFAYVQTLTAPDGVANDRFGIDVATDDSTLLIGAPYAGGTGAVYVFQRSTDGWLFAQKLTPSDAKPSGLFGVSVAVSGSRLLVGASWAGEAYVFDRGATGWTETSRLAGDGIPRDYFGVGVALQQDTAVVTSIGTSAIPGAAFQFFATTPTQWTRQAKYVATGSHVNDGFGTSVALSDAYMIVGDLATYAFDVNVPSVATACAAPCTTSSTITVSWTDARGYAADMVVLAPADGFDTDITASTTTNGAVNGQTTFVGVPLGRYVARIFAASTGELVAESAPFDVTEAP